jgi:hypothetical protein
VAKTSNRKKIGDPEMGLSVQGLKEKEHLYKYGYLAPVRSEGRTEFPSNSTRLSNVNITLILPPS